MRIAIGSDHAGVALKEKIKAFLKRKKIKVTDYGTHSEESCDYPDIAYPVARAVARRKFDRGILICGSGVGVTITANKVRGIRAVNAYDVYTAEQSREHGDCNVLCLAGRKLAPKKALKIVEVWIRTKFSRDARHLRRIRKIERR